MNKDLSIDDDNDTTNLRLTTNNNLGGLRVFFFEGNYMDNNNINEIDSYLGYLLELNKNSML